MVHDYGNTINDPFYTEYQNVQCTLQLVSCIWQNEPMTEIQIECRYGDVCKMTDPGIPDYNYCAKWCSGMQNLTNENKISIVKRE